ncbi:MAG: 23S rRNA pseudouridine(2604) synthase RluF [Flavobacteriaceae bacterium]|jgi:23S rRNA pseudouridine2604 synthase|nr:23S rRNA pseudouridine(2604) synthase RluF [Flavobacteriaceae bacterium]
MEKNETRLNKYLSEVGYCSRRAADRLIEEGRITVNGVVPEMGLKVSDADEIRVNGELIRNSEEKHVYLAFNKPVGIECTTNEKVRDNIVSYINYPKRIFPVGRLDKDSEGLIIMTSDGDIVNKILRQRNNHEKEYIVTVNKPVTDRFIQRMGNGVPILDTITKKCRVEKISKTVFRIFLTQGLNRQIRRMCEYLDYDVVALKRIRIINIALDVPVGKYRELSQVELDELNRLIAPSIMTEEASFDGSEQSQQSIRKRVTTGRNGGRKEEPRAKRNFEREKNNSVSKVSGLKNERLRKRRRED